MPVLMPTPTLTFTPTAELPLPLQQVPMQRWPQGAAEHDTVAAEVPVALVFNGISHAVMMATPHDLEDFALGFALSEGILDSPEDCYGIELIAHAPAHCMPSECGADMDATLGAGRGAPELAHEGAEANVQADLGLPAVEVQLRIAASCFERLKQQRRTLAGRTGCGVCGVESLQRLAQQVHSLPQRQAEDQSVAVSASTVLAALQALPSLQPLNRECGSLHAAAWARWDGTLCHATEDIGRHNALDKLLGWRARQGDAVPAGFVVMSSRTSYELVHKCARLQVPLLATISAPTSLALQLAQQAGMQLWGMGRAPQIVRYT